MIRRTFLATINYSHPQYGMIHAFSSLFPGTSGHYDYLQRIREGCTKEFVNQQFFDDVVRFKPDWLWLQLQNTDVITAETLGRIERELPRCVITHWCGDVRPEVGAYYASICRATHLTFVANRGFIPKYQEAGAREVRYLAHGLDWEQDVMGQPEWTPPFQVPDVVYCGNHYGASLVGTDVREASVRALTDAGVDIGVVGRGWDGKGLKAIGECHVKQQVHVYRRAKVVLSVNHFPDLEGYHGDRTITAMASGTPVVQRHFPGLESEFTPGEDLLTYPSSVEVVDIVKGLLQNEPLRRKIGAGGRAAAIRSHTWLSRVLSVLPRVEEISEELARK